MLEGNCEGYMRFSLSNFKYSKTKNDNSDKIKQSKERLICIKEDLSETDLHINSTLEKRMDNVVKSLKRVKDFYGETRQHEPKFRAGY